MKPIIITPKREAKFRNVARRRQTNLTVILENVHDPHNIGAVLRSCDSVGIAEVFVLYSEPELTEERLFLSKKTASGALKWIDVQFFTDEEACFSQVKEKYDKIYSTHLSEDAVEFYDLDMTESVALLFGNEHGGVSEAAQKYADGNFIIPQVGMVESLNISVACAVTLYEAFRQRRAKGIYDVKQLSDPQQNLFDKYVAKHKTKSKSRFVSAKND